MEFHGITYVELHGTTWHSMELHGYSMEIHGTPWNSKKLHEYFMEFHGHEFLSNSMEFHGEILHTGYDLLCMFQTRYSNVRSEILFRANCKQL